MDIKREGYKLDFLKIPPFNGVKATHVSVRDYAVRVGVYAREHADRVGTDAKAYVDRSTERFRRRFHDFPFAFIKDNGNFVVHTPISMASQPVNDLSKPKKVSYAVTKKYVDDLMADEVGAGRIDGGGRPLFQDNGNQQATHTINMAFKKLLNLSTPSDPYEAATKEYVDNKIT